MTLRRAVPDALLGLVKPYAEAKKVEPELLVRLMHACFLLDQQGIPFKLGEMRRSSERQAQLYAQGRTKPGPIVTHAKPGQSKHEHGRAGHIEVAYQYRKQLGEAMETAGLVWGGRWLKFGPDGDWQHGELA